MKFRKLPVVIDAEEFQPDRLPWPDGVLHMAHHQIEGWCKVPYPFTPYGMWSTAKFRIDTLEGGRDLTPGDWIITGVQGETYPCKPDIFAATYEAVDG